MVRDGQEASQEKWPNKVINADQEIIPGTFVELRAGERDALTRVAPNVNPLRAPQTATINVTYNGFPAAAEAAFQHAVDIWETQISSPIAIEVVAEWTALDIEVLGQVRATDYHRNFDNAPVADILYPQALANALAEDDVSAGTSDLEAYFNSDLTNWYFGTDGNPPAGQYDFVTVALHEIGHGLGFFGSANVVAGSGSWGDRGISYIYDTFVENGSGQKIIDTGLFANPSAALAVQLQGGDLFFNGSNAVAANGGTAPKLYAPAAWEWELSYSHLDEATYPAGDSNSLMTPQLDTAEAIHDPGDIARALLRDLGWPTKAPPPTGVPIPELKLEAINRPGIGEELQFRATFKNVGTEVGYGPFIQLMFPTSGADGSGSDTPRVNPGIPCDGIEFVNAKFLDADVDQNLVSTACPVTNSSQVGQLVSVDNTSPLTDSMKTIAGNQILTLLLPFGSFTPGQPEAEVIITAKVSNFADIDAPLIITGRSGFFFGDDPEGHAPPALDDTDSETSKWDETLEINFNVSGTFSLAKYYLGPENETATGPNHPKRYRLSVDIPRDQYIDNLIISDTLPNNVTYLRVVSTSPSGASVTPPLSTPGGELRIDFSSLGRIEGTSSSSEASATIEFYVPEKDANDDLVLDPNSAAFANSVNNAIGTSYWEPEDPRDESGGVTASASHTLSNKSLAIQKGVSMGTDRNHPGATPDDTLQYNLYFQVSDFFAIGNLVVEDFLSDGQTFVAGSARLQLSDQHGSVASSAFPVSNITLGAKCSGASNTTPITFDVSPAMQTLGHTNDYLTGGHAGASPTNVAATGVLTFEATIDDEFSCSGFSGNANVDERDLLSNSTTISGEVQGITGGNPAPSNGVIARDSSGDSITIASGTFQKQIYAINGDTNLTSPIHIRPADEVTFRLIYTFPAGDAEDVFIEDMLPLPILDVDDVGVSNWVFNGTASNSAPPAGTIRPVVGSITSTPSKCSSYGGAYAKSSSNSLCLNYGDRMNPSNTTEKIDLLFTIQMNTKPYVDQLRMTNTGRHCERNSHRQQSCQLKIADFITSEPILRINRKGVVATDNINGEFEPALTGQVQFSAPGSACPRFTAPVTSSALSPPVNSDLLYVDANDKVSYAIIVENTGTGEAFDVKVDDNLPAGVQFAPGSLCVSDGTGASLPSTGNLFSGGLELTNPLGSGKSIPGYSATAGKNILIITYDALLDNDIVPGTYENQANLLHYAGAAGKENHVGSGFGGPFSDVAQVLIHPRASKSIVQSSEAHTILRDLTIGEVARYRLRIELPEGASPGTSIIDKLPSGFTMIDGTAKVAFVSNGTGISSSSAALSGLANVNGDQSTIDSITPSVNFPAGNLTGGPVEYTFDLGDLTNRDDDNDREYVIIEFNALVNNISSNVAYQYKYNNFTVRINEQQIANASVRSTLVEPNMSLSKTVLNQPVGARERAVYRVSLYNSGNSTAFDLDLNDILPSGLISLTVRSVISPTGTIVTDNSTDEQLDLVIDSLKKRQSITVEYEAKLLADSQCDQIRNTATLTYTSLPGPNGTVGNPTGSSAPGASGATNGERNGSRTGSNNYYRQASADLCPDLSIKKSHLGDFIPGKNAIYSLEITNVGSGPTNGQVVVTDTLPSGLAYVSSSGASWMANAWSCNATGQELVCTHPGPINPTKTSMINIEVAVSTVTDIQNCAEVSTPADKNPANNQSCDQTKICLPDEEPILTLDPVISTLSISDTVTVEVRLEQVTDTRSIQLELNFDPTEVEVVDADGGRAGIQIEPGSCPQSDIVLINEADNSTGVIRYLASSTFSSCYGDGVVAKITFRALKGGMSPVSFVNWGLSTSKGKQIELTCTQGMPLHVVPKGNIQGTVRLFGSVSNPEGVKVTLMDGTGTEVGSMTTAADGNYEFNDLLVGAYTLKAEKDMFLYALRTVLIQDGQTTVFPEGRRALADNTVIVPEMVLWPGDSNGDDKVNLADLLPFSQLLNDGHDLLAGISCANPPGWDPSSEALQMSVDFNSDCTVDIKDITLQSTTIGAFFNGCNGSVAANVPIQCVAPGSRAEPALPLP